MRFFPALALTYGLMMISHNMKLLAHWNGQGCVKQWQFAMAALCKLCNAHL
jgi:hypothetical protein